MDEMQEMFELDLKVYVRATSTAEAADKLTKALYDAIVAGDIADFRATGQPRKG